MKKRAESLAFIAVALVIIFSLRFVLGKCERTEREYQYAGSLHLEEETAETTEKTEEVTETQEDLDDDTEPEETEEEQETENDAEDADNDSQDNSSTDGTGNTPGTGTADGSGDSGTGGDGDGGSGGNGGPGGTAVPVAKTPEPEITATKKPEPEKSAKPEKSAEPTKEPEDEIESIMCSWPDKDTLIYGEEIPGDTIVVTAVYQSGKEEEIPKGDYQISGLRNSVCGKHKLTVIYEEFETMLTYTVLNYIDHLKYDWEERNNCYKGEVIDDNVLTVYAVMADGKEEEILFGDYDLTGIDNQKTEVKQTFTIRYQGRGKDGSDREFTVEDSCIFHAQTVTVHNIFCTDGSYLDIVQELVSDPNEVRAGQRINSLEPDTEKSYNGEQYLLKREEFTVDGKSKVLPYTVQERNFDMQIYRYFVRES